MTAGDSESAGRIHKEPELDQLEDVVRFVLDYASRGGATQAEVTADTSQGLAVTVRKGEVDVLEHTKDRGVNLTVFIGRKKGYASCADLSESSILECVEKAIEIARFTQEDACNGLADPELMATEFPDLDLWHPTVLDADAVITRAQEIEAAGLADSRISNSEGASVSAGFGVSVYGNTHGFVGRTSGTRFGQNCVLIAGKGATMQRDYSFDSKRNLESLRSPRETGEEAARRTVARLGARKIGTREMPVVLAPEIARTLLGHLVAAISGSALYRNASFLKDRLGEQIFPDWLTLTEHPRLPRGYGSANFDAEGVATADRNVVDQGVLSGYVLSSYSARRLGTQTTANAGGVRNLTLEPGGRSPDAPLASIREGFLVTEMMGQGVNLVTGDYSRGAAGFLIENGKMAAPVEEVTIAGNLDEIFGNISCAGSDVDDRGNIRSGSVVIEKMMVAGA